MSLHMTPQEYAEAMRALGLPPPVVEEEDTKPSESVAIAAVSPALPSVSHTPTYTLLSAAIQISAVVYGAARVAIVPGGYAIAINAHFAYGVDITESRATVVSLHAMNGKRWRKLESTRMPLLAPSELLDLFVRGEHAP